MKNKIISIFWICMIGEGYTSTEEFNNGGQVKKPKKKLIKAKK